jgi:hypothetical protein
VKRACRISFVCFQKQKQKKSENSVEKKNQEATKKKKKPIKEANVAHIVLVICWPITCIRPLWYCFKLMPISTHCWPSYLAHSWHIICLLAFVVLFKNLGPFQLIVGFLFNP